MNYSIYKYFNGRHQTTISGYTDRKRAEEICQALNDAAKERGNNVSLKYEVKEEK